MTRFLNKILVVIFVFLIAASCSDKTDVFLSTELEKLISTYADSVYAQDEGKIIHVFCEKWAEDTTITLMNIYDGQLIVNSNTKKAGYALLQDIPIVVYFSGIDLKDNNLINTNALKKSLPGLTRPKDSCTIRSSKREYRLINGSFIQKEIFLPKKFAGGEFIELFKRRRGKDSEYLLLCSSPNCFVFNVPLMQFSIQGEWKEHNDTVSLLMRTLMRGNEIERVNNDSVYDYINMLIPELLIRDGELLQEPDNDIFSNMENPSEALGSTFIKQY